MEDQKTVRVGKEVVGAVREAVRAELAYERVTHGGRKLGITGEVGEVLACHLLGLKMVTHPRSEGFDAIDSRGLRVEIKTRRSESEGLPRDAGRVSTFSAHKFDYALLVLLNRQYEVAQIWRAEYEGLWPVIESQKRRNPNLSSFKRVGRRVFPPD